MNFMNNQLNCFFSLIRLNDRNWHRENRANNDNNFNMHYRSRIASLYPHQTAPPTSDTMIFPERHSLSSLFLYHHCNGHEFVDVGAAYAELDQGAHDWLNAKDFNTENLDALRIELNQIIDTEIQPPPITTSDARTILAIIDKMALLEQHPSAAINVITRFNDIMDPNQLILACASCGEEHAVNFDKDRTGEEVTGYEHNLRDLDVLKLSVEVNFTNIKKSDCISRFFLNILILIL